MSTAIDIAKIGHPGAGIYLYSEIEAAAKEGNYSLIKETQGRGGCSYSVSNLEPDDRVGAMNYVGQELGATLFKAVNELPLALRKDEIFLRSIEVLLGNVLHSKFNENSHNILDSLAEHVHMGLSDLDASKKVH